MLASSALAQPHPRPPALALLGSDAFIPVSLTGDGFGSPGAGSSLDVVSTTASLSIPSTTSCTAMVTHSCIAHWEGDWIIAKLPPTMTQARVRVVTGACPANCSELMQAEYYAYDYAKTRLESEIAGVPIAIALDPADPLRRVWLNEEAHSFFKTLTPGQPVTDDLTLLHPTPRPFYTGYAAFGPQQTVLSQSGEDVLVDPYGRAWFSEGGWPSNIADGYWSYSRVVMHRYDPEDPASIVETRVYNIPGQDSEVVGLAYEQDYESGKDRVWYTTVARKVHPLYPPIIPARIGWFDPDEADLAHDGTRAFTTATSCLQYTCTRAEIAFQSCCADNSERRCANSFDCAGSSEVCYSDAPTLGCKFHEFLLPATTHSPAHLAIGLDGAIWYADYWGGSNLGRLDPDSPTGDVTLFPLGDDPTRGPSWLLGSAPWELQVAANGDLIVNEYADAVINRFDVSRVDDPDCLTLVSGQNPCVTSVAVPGPDGHAQHTIHLDGRENVWFTTIAPENASPEGLATVGYVKSDWSGAVMLPTPTLFPLEPDEPVAGAACSNPEDPDDPFRGFHGTGVTVDPTRGDVWFGDFCRQRIGRVVPTSIDLAVGKTATQASTLYGLGAQHAVDANVDGALAAGSIAQTIATLPAQPWWEVDLGEVSFIQSIEVWNRTDSPAFDWLEDFYVLVSETPFGSGNLATVLAATPNENEFYEAGPAARVQTFTVGRNARYVRVQLAGSTSLALAEVVVLGRPGRNLALGQTATQASTIFGAVAARAVDGKIDGAYANGSVAQTIATLPSAPWWQVDLGSVQDIGRIEVWNRTDAAAIGWLEDFYVFVSDVPFTSGNLATTLAQVDDDHEFHTPAAVGPGKVFNVNTSGRYVRVQAAGNDSLALAEVVVTAPGAP